MRKLLLLLLCFICWITTKAQVALYSDQLQHFAVTNPAYAGAQERFNLTLSQFGMSRYTFKEYTETRVSQQVRIGKFGFGGSFHRNKILQYDIYDYSAQVAYHIALPENRQLSLGLSAKVMDWNVDNTIPIPVWGFTPLETTITNLGLGVFYQGKVLEMGLSFPELVGGRRVATNNQIYHYRPLQFLIAAKIPIIESLYLKPSILITDYYLLNEKGELRNPSARVNYALALVIDDRYMIGSSGLMHAIYNFPSRFVEEANLWIAYQSAKKWRVNLSLGLRNQPLSSFVNQYVYKVTFGYRIK